MIYVHVHSITHKFLTQKFTNEINANYVKYMSGIYLQCTISIVVFVSVFVAVVLFQNALKTFAEAGKEDDEDIRKGG